MYYNRSLVCIHVSLSRGGLQRSDTAFLFVEKHQQARRSFVSLRFVSFRFRVSAPSSLFWLSSRLVPRVLAPHLRPLRLRYAYHIIARSSPSSYAYRHVSHSSNSSSQSSHHRHLTSMIIIGFDSDSVNRELVSCSS